MSMDEHAESANAVTTMLLSRKARPGAARALFRPPADAEGRIALAGRRAQQDKIFDAVSFMKP
jgi:hypothetical protein